MLFFPKTVIRIAFFSLLVTAGLVLQSCETIDLYERVVPIPGHRWESSYKPSFTFTIADTTAPYQLYFIIRHNNRYHYNNIWLNIYRKEPSGRVTKIPYELTLATNDRGWLGVGMDDLFEHRVLLQPPPDDSLRIQAGDYTFTVEHAMREDPLEEVMNVGLRLEKKLL